MKLRNKVGLIIYRFRERGLEVFLVSSEDGKSWEIPKGEVKADGSDRLREADRLIQLDPVKQAGGEEEEAIAVEGEWHDIPSLKAMMYEDAVALKDKLKEMEKGTFFVVKEAFKKVLPHQYAFIKELKDILVDRNSLKDL